MSESFKGVAPKQFLAGRKERIWMTPLFGVPLGYISRLRSIVVACSPMRWTLCDPDHKS